MNEQVIASLAILKVNWDEGHDYIDNFVPFIAECLRVSSSPIVSLGNVQDSVFGGFGLKIPQGALRTILARACRYGYIKREKKLYRINFKTLVSLDFASKKSAALRQYEAVVSKFMDFCSNQYERMLSRDDAEGIILSYVNKYSTPILSTAIEDAPFPKPTRNVEDSEFLINSFIEYIKDSDPYGFEFLVTIVKGSMLASTLYLPDLNNVNSRFNGVKVYLDTGFILRALGYSRQGTHTPCKELLDLLYRQNVELRCFQHTLNEIYSILEVDVNELRSGSYVKYGYSGSLEYFVNSKFSASDVELIIIRLRFLLKNLRIFVEDKPSFSERFSLDEKKLESTLQEVVGYKSKNTLLIDLESLTAIYRLRRGHFPVRLESCYAIFITTNTNLSRAGRRFFGEEFSEGKDAIPIALPDYVLTTLVWLKSPLSAPDLPRKKVIADCYAALNPSETLWRRYLGEINKLRDEECITEEDYLLLRFSSQAKSLLTKSTLGNPSAIVEGTVEEILEESKAAIRAEAEEAFRKERRRRKELQEELGKAESKVKIKEEEASAFRRSQIQKFRRYGNLIGAFFSKMVFTAIIGALSIGALVNLVQFFEKKILSQLSFSILFAFLIFWVALSFFNITIGIPIRSLIRWIEVSVSNFVENNLTVLTEPDKKEAHK